MRPPSMAVRVKRGCREWAVQKSRELASRTSTCRFKDAIELVQRKLKWTYSSA